jgi:hypothetical protein
MLRAIDLQIGADRDRLPINSDQKRTGMKFDRASFRIVRKPTLNTSGVRDRSMTEEVPTRACHSRQNLRRSQTGIIFGLRQSQP